MKLAPSVNMTPHSVHTIARSVRTFGKHDATFGTQNNTFTKRACEVGTFNKLILLHYSVT